jgi:hypothetical protein
MQEAPAVRIRLQSTAPQGPGAIDYINNRSRRQGHAPMLAADPCVSSLVYAGKWQHCSRASRISGLDPVENGTTTHAATVVCTCVPDKPCPDRRAVQSHVRVMVWSTDYTAGDGTRERDPSRAARRGVGKQARCLPPPHRLPSVVTKLRRTLEKGREEYSDPQRPNRSPRVVPSRRLRGQTLAHRRRHPRLSLSPASLKLAVSVFTSVRSARR